MTQTPLTIFLLTLMVLVGILLNRHDASRLGQIEGWLDGRMTAIETRMSALEARLHGDMLMLIGKVTEVDVRVAKLEVER